MNGLRSGLVEFFRTGAGIRAGLVNVATQTSIGKNATVTGDQCVDCG
ncbi:hypothetical protein ECDEC7C_5348 [Escherichia coli DEC7C]|nr:hypothetical protein ECDEC7C_5348 [Escherichia coli DEC7C]